MAPTSIFKCTWIGNYCNVRSLFISSQGAPRHENTAHLRKKNDHNYHPPSLEYNAMSFGANGDGVSDDSKRIVQVQYKTPDYVHVSQNCRQLLARIFIANPAWTIDSWIVGLQWQAKPNGEFKKVKD